MTSPTPFLRLALLILLGLFTPVLWAQETLEIPRSHIEEAPDLADLPSFDVMSPDGTMGRLYDSMEDAAGKKLLNTLPAAVTEKLGFALPLVDEADVVWELEAWGSWNETVSGTGKLSVVDMAKLGEDPALQLSATLGTDQRGWNFSLIHLIPEGTPDGQWQAFSKNDGGNRTAFGATTNHLFEYERTLGHATPKGMASRTFGPGTTREEYLYTAVEHGRIRAYLDNDGYYRMHFLAQVSEYLIGRTINDEPTFRDATLSGWICSADLHAHDPEACELDNAFALIDHTPGEQRPNVNPTHPTITLTFSKPVDAQSLSDNFRVTTQAEDGATIEIDGGWEESPHPGAWRDTAKQRLSGANYAALAEELACEEANITSLAHHPEPHLEPYIDPREYIFHPATALLSGVRYQVDIQGGRNGVVAQTAAADASERDEQDFLPKDRGFNFSTLLHLDWQAPLDQEDALDQEEEALELFVYQPVRDPALVTRKPTLTRLYPDWELQPIADLWQPRDYAFELHMDPEHPTVYRQGGKHAERLGEATVLANLVSQSRTYPHVMMSPGPLHVPERSQAHHTVNFFGWEPQDSDPDELTLTACPHDPFPHALPSAIITQEKPVEYWDHDPGDLTIYTLIPAIGRWEDPLPQVEDTYIRQGLDAAATYVPQFYPYRNAHLRIIDSNSVPAYSDALLKAEDPTGYAQANEQSENNRLYAKMDIYTRIVGKILRERFNASRSNSVLLILLPDGTIAGDAEGAAVSELSLDDYASSLGAQMRSIAAQVPSQTPPRSDDIANYTTQEFAAYIIHEIGHTLSLPHYPGDRPSGSSSGVGGLTEQGNFKAPIEGYRLDASGQKGWNKSYIEGNEETDVALLTPMWPRVVNIIAMMLLDEQYEATQHDIKTRYL